MTDNEDEVEYIAQSALGWGKGQHAHEALHNLLRYNDAWGNTDGKITIIKVSGEWEINFHSVRAEEIQHEVTYSFDTERLNHIADLLNRVEIGIEDAFVDAEEIEDEDDADE